MIKAVLLWAFAYFLLPCQGLELTLDRTFLGSSDSRIPCGVLLCVERSLAGTNATLPDNGGGDSSSSLSDQLVAEISSLKVFKVKSTSSSSNTKRSRSLLASVSPQQSRLSRVSNGMKVDGRLERGRASLRLKLNKETDCRAEFVCQVHGVDTEGRQLERTSHILQRGPIKDEDKGEGINRDSGLTLQVLALIQELNAKLAVMGSTVGSLGQEMDRLRETVVHDVESLRNDLNGKSDRLVDKAEVGNKHLEDKLEAIDNKMDTKTDRLEDKIESMKNRLEDSIKSLANGAESEDAGGSSSCQNELSDRFGRQLSMGMSNLEEKMMEIKGDLAELGTAIYTNVDEHFIKINQQLQAVEEMDDTVRNNISIASSGESCKNIQDLSDVVSDNFFSLSNNLEDKFTDISSSIKSSATEVHKVLTGQVFPGNLTSGRNLQYRLVNLLTPKTCYKGMSAYVPTASNKYTVIDPSPENGLKAPVLCDMRTDGGGWVVFQRRVIGDVDFYKGWEEYKRGFGSLYGDFWLGNDAVHNITSTGNFELRIDMKYKEKSGFARYGGFSIEDEAGKYAIHFSNFDGTAGDSLTGVHKGASFSTHDRDNDAWNQNCAVSYTGAWWYKACHHSNLNGQWAASGNKGPRWSTFSSTNAVSFSEMKIRQLVGKTV